jgi:hypothetical protein
VVDKSTYWCCCWWWVTSGGCSGSIYKWQRYICAYSLHRCMLQTYSVVHVDVNRVAPRLDCTPCRTAVLEGVRAVQHNPVCRQCIEPRRLYLSACCVASGVPTDLHVPTTNGRHAAHACKQRGWCGEVRNGMTIVRSQYLLSSKLDACMQSVTMRIACSAAGKVSTAHV